MIFAEQFAAANLATLVVPVAVYFLVLGLLNSRPTPQLLSGRRDFLLLVGALSPLVIVPVVSHWGLSPAALGLAAVALGALSAVLMPRGWSWVIYNLPAPAARQLVQQALDDLGWRHREADFGFCAADGLAVRVVPFPLLRNVSVRLFGASSRQAGQFEAALGSLLARRQATTSPMAVSLLLVATAMLVTPLTLLAPRAPELVRLLTNLLP